MTMILPTPGLTRAVPLVAGFSFLLNEKFQQDAK